MRMIATRLKQQLIHSITFRVFLAIGLLTLVVAWPGLRSAARQGSFQRGDVFASLGDGKVLRFSQTTGTLLQTLDTATGSFVTGSAFDKDSNLYVTAFGTRAVVKFDNNGNRVGDFGSSFTSRPESILFDPDGNAFIGTVDANADVFKLDKNGNALDNYDVATERRGSDWIDLAADRCTLYYTSEGSRILRFDVCTKTGLPDFATNLPHSAAYALRLLPSGGLIVADTNEILRLDSTGNIIQRYDAPGEDSWFAMNLDPDGTSLWSAGIASGNIYKFDIASGNQLTRITTGAGAIYGLSILGEITVVNPTPSPTGSPTATPTATPEGSADLVLTKTASPGLVTNGTLLTYNARITNNGPTPAINVVLSDTLPLNTTFVACNANGTGTCTGAGRNRGATFPRVGVGETVTVTIVVRVECAGITSTTLTNSAQVTSANFDPNTANNSAQASVNVAPPQPRITFAGGSPSGLDFGAPVQLRREGVANPPSYSFTVENTGCLPLVLGFGVARTGSDVSSGRISNPDDRSTFPIALTSGGGATFLGDENVTIQGGTSASFRIFFNPKIPAAAGKTSGLNASQAIPELINSLLTISTNATDIEGKSQNFSYPLVGRVTDEVKFINPTAPSLSPLIVVARNNDIFSVEFSVHDANMDFFCAVYQFLNVANVPVGDAVNFYFGEDVAKANMVRGQSFTVVKQFTGANRRPEVRRVRVTVFDNLNHSVELSSDVGTEQGRVVNASAASFATESLAPESIAAAFGAKLATTTRVAATSPLPNELAGTRVSVTDSRGIERAAPLFFVSTGQVNYQVPANTAAGPAVVTIVSGDGSVSSGNVNITSVAPAIFTASANGQGVANGLVLRVRSNGTQSFEPIARLDAPTQRYVPVAIDVSNSSEQVYLVLFGSGIRNRRSPQPVGATVGGLNVPVYYAGAQGTYVGVDQVNLLLPRTLAGRGEIEVRLNVDGRAANPVRVQIR